VDELLVLALAHGLKLRTRTPARTLVGPSGNQIREGGTVDGARKERRGFASMSREKQREIASKGGRAAHEKGTAHEWTPDEARAAGRKGGQSSRGGRGRLVPVGATGENRESETTSNENVNRSPGRMD
jgi:general stress protein YciG